MDFQRRLENLIREVTQRFGVELMDAALKGYGKKQILIVTIDKKGGVTIKDCENVSRKLDALLDEEDLMQGSYTLEVTSPGLERPLTQMEDFIKNKGNLLRVTTKEKIHHQHVFIGRLKEVSREGIVLEIDKTIVEIGFANISKARLEIEI